jgi:hypothetical protein
MLAYTVVVHVANHVVHWCKVWADAAVIASNWAIKRAEACE